MNFLSLKRAISFGWLNFKRNRESSWVLVLVVSVLLLLISCFFLIRGLSDALVSQIREQVSVAAYFQRETSSADIIDVKLELEEFFSEDIKEIKIVSAEEALSHFSDRYRGDPLYQKALDQIGENPFLASLDIIVANPERYSDIADYLIENHSGLINKVDYHNREMVIERVFSFTSQVEFVGLIVSLVLVFLLILIVFSTTRFSIHSSRYEVDTMKLVGSPNWFIRAPFVIQGLIGGLIATILVLVVLVPLVYFFSPHLEASVAGFNLWQFLVDNIFRLVALQLVVALFLGGLSAFLAVRRYLKI
jgi:cell division transport system permease protein